MLQRNVPKNVPKNCRARRRISSPARRVSVVALKTAGSCMMKAMLVAALTGCVLAPLAQAQERASESASLYPSRPVTFVVPFTPGGSTSLIARLVGQHLEQRLGKPFII